MSGKILIVDDDQDMCETLQMDLRRHGHEVIWRTSGEEAFNLINDFEIDIVLVDLFMPEINGIDLCHRIVTNWPDIPVIAMTAFGSLETAIEAIRAGAYDFITKPIDFEFLRLRLSHALKHRSLQERVKVLGEALERASRFETLLGSSPPMQKLYDQLTRMADSEASVLITGESGTGKELVARVLHKRSRRADGAFVAISCPALPETLLESELFGHVRGAFTDARSERKGVFLQAHGGTVFLDEIGDLPQSLQPKLLRALEAGTIRPVGADREFHFDARIIAATNHDLESAVHEGRFREDLFFRINVIQVELPPLRDRGSDILILAQHFVEGFTDQSNKKVVGLSESVAEKLLDYGWPGNVRELRNAMERAVALTRFEKIVVEDLPERIRTYQKTHLTLGGDNTSELLPMEEVERRYILHVLKTVGHNKTLAARVLGLDRKTLYRKLERYGVIEPSSSSDSTNQK